MRLIGALSLVFTLALTLAIRGEPQATTVQHRQQRFQRIWIS